MLSASNGGHNKYDLPNFYSSPPMKDSSELSLVDFCALAKTPLKRNRVGKSRGPADALRTVCWYRYLASERPGITAYALGKLVEPDAYKVDWDGKSRLHMHSNKWIRYARGAAVPQSAIVASLDGKYPGSAALINNPVWLLIDRQFSSLGQLARVKTCFVPQVQLAIDAVTPPSQWTFPELAALYATRLILLDPLDSLGAITYLLWQSKLREDTFAQVCWARCAYSAMLIHGADLRAFGIALPMFELLKQNLLCAVEHESNGLDYPSSLYLLSVELLGSFYIKHPRKHRGKMREFIYQACTLEHGYAPAVITWAIPVPVGDFPSPAHVEEYEMRQRIFSWALTSLSANNFGAELSPDTIMDFYPLVF